MNARELIAMLEKHPDAPVAVMAGDDYQNKKRLLSVYYSADGEMVIEYWDREVYTCSLNSSCP